MNSWTCVRAVGLFTSLCWCFASYAQYAPPTPRSYTLPESESRTGSNLRAQLATLTGGLPPDKRYSELTLEQKNQFKAQYQSMADEDEPPFPADGLGTLYRPIFEAMQTLRVEGVLDMEVEVDSAGKAKSVSVRKSPAPEVTTVAAAALMFQVYKPAVCRGKPCAMAFPLRMELVRR